MFRIVFVGLVAFQTVAFAAPQDDVKDALAHAEALYYGARFNESITLLARVDDALKTQPDRLQDRISTKLRLALAHIGLNELPQAKALLIELYALDSNYVLDADQFSPKVIAVAAEAKADQIKVQCSAAQTDARNYLQAGKTAALLDLDRSLRKKCVGLAALEPEAAETFYRAGVAAFRLGDFANALSNFEAAVTLSPEHELAVEYINLTHSKLQVSDDRLLLNWQKNFDAHQLKEAATGYQQMVASGNNRNGEAINHMNGEYRKALSAVVDKWNSSCTGNDAEAKKTLRAQISELLPEPSFGEDIQRRMVECPEPVKTVSVRPAPEPPPAPPAAATPTGCLDMPAQLALTRLKTRVDPVITNEFRLYFKNSAQIAVRVKSRISETGDVTIMGFTDGNPLVNTVVGSALAQWKFSPTRDQSGLRCVDTEIPISIKLAK